MEDLEWIARMNKYVVLAGLLKDEPIGDMLGILDRIDSVGPIMDPTAYRAGAQNIGPQRKLLKALLEVQNVIQELEEAAKIAGLTEEER